MGSKREVHAGVQKELTQFVHCPHTHTHTHRHSILYMNSKKCKHKTNNLWSLNFDIFIDSLLLLNFFAFPCFFSEWLCECCWNNWKIYILFHPSSIKCRLVAGVLEPIPMVIGQEAGHQSIAGHAHHSRNIQSPINLMRMCLDRAPVQIYLLPQVEVVKFSIPRCRFGVDAGCGSPIVIKGIPAEELYNWNRC